MSTLPRYDGAGDAPPPASLVMPQCSECGGIESDPQHDERRWASNDLSDAHPFDPVKAEPPRQTRAQTLRPVTSVVEARAEARRILSYRETHVAIPQPFTAAEHRLPVSPSEPARKESAPVEKSEPEKLLCQICGKPRGNHRGKIDHKFEPMSDAAMKARLTGNGAVEKPKPKPPKKDASRPPQIEQNAPAPPKPSTAAASTAEKVSAVIAIGAELEALRKEASSIEAKIAAKMTELQELVA